MANVRREEEGEMSIEEILASIRRYVGDEQQPQPKEDTLSLSPSFDQSYIASKTDVEQTAERLAASLSMTPKSDLKVEASTFDPNVELPRSTGVPENVIRLTEVHAIKSEPQAASKTDTQEGLLSAQAQVATAQSFAKLAEATTHIHHLSKPEATSPTLDQLVADLARPMIKQWLDQHLPRLVELTVTKEIERLTKQLRSD